MLFFDSHKLVSFPLPKSLSLLYHQKNRYLIQKEEKCRSFWLLTYRISTFKAVFMSGIFRGNLSAFVALNLMKVRNVRPVCRIIHPTIELHYLNSESRLILCLLCSSGCLPKLLDLQPTNMEDLHQHLLSPLPLLFTKRSLIELNAKTKYYKLTVFLLLWL